MRLNLAKLALIALAWSAVVGCAPTDAIAQGTPSAKPLKIIVPVPPGGASDLVARQIQQPLSEALGQPVVVENRPGGNGIIGFEAMVRSPADGTVIATASSSLVAGPALYASLPFDTLKDIRGITNVARAPNLLSVPPSSPLKSFADVIEAAKRAPGKVIIATSGNGSAQHFGLEHLKILTATDIMHLPYKGAGPALNDLVAGQVGIGLLNIAGSIPFVKTGQLRPLAVTSPKRSASLPDVPAISETLPGFDMSEFFAFVTQSGVPDATVERIYAGIVKAARTPAFEAKLRDAGMELELNTPAEFQSVMLAEHKRLGDLARKAGIRLD